LSRNQARHTDSLSFSDLLLCVHQLLSVDGKFCVILPLQQATLLQQMSVSYQLFCEAKLLVYPKQNRPANRCLIQFSRKCQTNIQAATLTLRNTHNNKYTLAYQELTHHFHPMY